MRIRFDGIEPDHPFRSALERDVAVELDARGVEWRYEVRVVLPDGSSPYYLPDFTIDQAPDELMLPEWVECKPQQMLYDLRDVLGVTRQAGEYFETDVFVDLADAEALKAKGVEELWKPKMLAEKTGGSVLIVGKVGGSRTLTATMRPDDIMFSRSHPFVNWRTIEKEREQERRRAEYERQEAERQRRYAATAAKERTKRLEGARAVVASVKRLRPRFSSECYVCRTHADTGGLYRVKFTNDREGWIRICPTCEADAS